MRDKVIVISNYKYNDVDSMYRMGRKMLYFIVILLNSNIKECLLKEEIVFSLFK